MRPNYTNVGLDRDPILRSYDPILRSHIRSYQLRFYMRSGKFFRGGIVGSYDPTIKIAILITLLASLTDSLKWSFWAKFCSKRLSLTLKGKQLMELALRTKTPMNYKIQR